MFIATLTLAEMLLLDGRCSDKVQEQVDRAKEARAIGERHGLEDGLALFVRDALAEARSAGRLVFQRKPVTRCAYTGRTGEWIRPAQGRARFPKDPVQQLFSAIEVKRAFVVVQHHASIGIDADVFPRVLPALSAELQGVQAEIPEAILGAPSPWRYSDRVKARCCGWTGAALLTEVRRDPHWFGLTCPGCGGKHRSMGPVNFDRVIGEHDVVAVSRLEAPAYPASTEVRPALPGLPLAG